MAQTFPDIPEDEITQCRPRTSSDRRCSWPGRFVHFGRTLRGYQVTNTGRVRVEFADRASDEGDLLVGADGVGSPVRQQLVPHATVRDLGLRCIYGRMTITDVTDALIPEDFNRGFCWVADEHGWGAGFAPVRFRHRPDGASDYLMTALVATSERLGMPDENAVQTIAT